MKKKLPIGISDFKKIIDGNYYYFDKTELIKSIIGEPGEVKLFTRPRRFGKTLNMSMIKYFFDIENKDKNKKLFENLKISENEYFEKQGTAPVISISFRNYDESNWENGFEMIKNTISDLYDEFEFVKENLSARKKEKYDSILFNRATEATWKLSLLDLTKYLYEYYGQKVVVLIDEYDQPIIDSYVKGYYQEAISFFKTFYGVVLKDNNYLEMGIMTGILRVAKENIFSGLNNLRVHTILDNRFTEYFGITESEVKQALKDFDLEFELKDVQRWYNGYLFGDIKVYNPWSIINFLNDEKLKPYWVNTSGNELIKLYLKKLKNEIFDDFSKLLNKKSILRRIDENMTFADLEANYEENIWNLFFHSGYLTLAEEVQDDEEQVYLKIPNEEILKMFSKMFIEVYFENYNSFYNMVYSLKNGDIETFKKELRKILLENVGIFDVSGVYKEQFYHGLMLGIILILKNEYEITSNNFSGKGRYDLILKPKNLEKRKEGIILELKVVNAMENLREDKIFEKLENECDTALQQIEEKEYASVLKNSGVENVLKIGIAFFGKEVAVKFDRNYS
ncbi:AAA family ATPase [Leptotrichia sp. oral taxon 223]|uniref:AAA family ATPase n=1 Tax=Leptotrichia sp. oral taxon 223 TaxID=712363 RepID=UPI0015BAA351|nr:AAA family ATPase [Leptotrichia sp. oral taxon 223]NWO19636.1 AAA family ATPase [Leptotrichia sp. oral taxon 223]